MRFGVKHPRTYPLPLAQRKPVLDFELSGTQCEVVALGPSESPRIETDHNGQPLEIETRDGAVVVRLSPSKTFWSEPPHKVRMHLPSDVRARVLVAAGELSITGLRGCDLIASTNAGSLTLSDVHGRLQLSAHAGKVVGERLSGTFDVEAGAGSVKLSVLALDQGLHHFHSAMGSVRLELARGLDVRIESSTVMGSTRTKYPSNASALTVLKLKAELGAVKVVETDVARLRGEPIDWRSRWGAGPAWSETKPAEANVTPPRPARPPRASSAELKQILALVKEQKITAEEAERLLRALGA